MSFKTIFKVISAFAVVQIITNSSVTRAECPMEEKDGVRWLASDMADYVTSVPECLDDLRFPVTRTCDGSSWTPSEFPTCAYTQKLEFEDRFPKFPGFKLLIIQNTVAKEDKDIVFYGVDNVPWNNDCIKHGLNNDIQFSFGDRFNFEDKWYWLAVRRPHPYFPYVDMTLINWGSIYDSSGNGLEDCMVFNMVTKTIAPTPCDSLHNTICAYDPGSSSITRQACQGTGQVTTTFNPDLCFSVSNGLTSRCDKYFTFQTPWDGLTLQALLKEFGLTTSRFQMFPFEGEEKYNEEKWKQSLDQVSFSNFAPDAVKLEEGNLVTDQNGLWRLSATIPRSICVFDLVVRKPQMFLTYDKVTYRMVLTILNQEFLWSADGDNPQFNCFTTHTKDLLYSPELEEQLSNDVIDLSNYVDNVNILESTVISKAVYALTPAYFLHFKFPYWCNSVGIPDYEVITTAVTFSEDYIEAYHFAMRVNIFCDVVSCAQELDSDELSKLTNLISSHILSDGGSVMPISDVYIMEVLGSSASALELLFYVVLGSSNIILEEIDLLSFETEAELKTEINWVRYLHDDLLALEMLTSDFEILDISPVYFCYEVVLTGSNQGKIVYGRTGETVVVPVLCLDEDGVFMNKKCEGVFPHGAVWEESSQCDPLNVPELTDHIFRIATAPDLITSDTLEYLNKLIEGEELNPSDVFLVGVILRSFSTAIRVNSIQDMQIVTDLFDTVQNMSYRTAQLSNMKLNSTNILVESYEKIACNLAFDVNITNPEALDSMGVMMFKSNNTITFIIDPNLKNVVGIALLRDEAEETSFKDLTVQYLFANTSANDLIENSLLEMATYVPFGDLQRLKTARVYEDEPVPLRIVISVIQSDLLFRPNIENVTLKPVSRVISASVLGYNDPKIPLMYPILFRSSRDFDHEDDFECGYWQFHAGPGANVSEWANDGCFYVAKSTLPKNPIVFCLCSHLTNFAFLLTGEFSVDFPTDPKEKEKLLEILVHLDLVTVVGCTMSLLGILCMWITGYKFKTWRNKEGTKVLLQFSVGIAIQTLLFLLLNIDGFFLPTKFTCIAVGVGLHFSVLVVFSWMMIIAYMQYLRYVVILGSLLPKHFFTKAIIVGWGLPTGPIVIILLIDVDLYVPNNVFDFKNVLCYPKGGALLYGVILPVASIVLFNLIVFIRVIYSIVQVIQKSPDQNANAQIRFDQLRLAIFLFFVLGLTWIFGLLVHVEGDSLVFTALFSITATLQGFVLFVYFIVLDPYTKALWRMQLNRFFR